MAIRPKKFTVNTDGVELAGVTYNQGDPIAGAALVQMRAVRPDLIDEHKPKSTSKKETQ